MREAVLVCFEEGHGTYFIELKGHERGKRWPKAGRIINLKIEAEVECVKLPPEIPTATPTPTPDPTPTHTPIPTRTPRPTPTESAEILKFATIFTINGRPYHRIQFQFAKGHDGCGLGHVHSNVTVYPYLEWVVRGGDDELITRGDAPLVDPEPGKCGFGTAISLGPKSALIPAPYFAEACGRIEVDRIKPGSDLEARPLSEFIEWCDNLSN